MFFSWWSFSSNVFCCSLTSLVYVIKIENIISDSLSSSGAQYFCSSHIFSNALFVFVLVLYYPKFLPKLCYSFHAGVCFSKKIVNFHFKFMLAPFPRKFVVFTLYVAVDPWRKLFWILIPVCLYFYSVIFPVNIGSMILSYTLSVFCRKLCSHVCSLNVFVLSGGTDSIYGIGILSLFSFILFRIRKRLTPSTQFVFKKVSVQKNVNVSFSCNQFVAVRTSFKSNGSYWK